MQKERAPQPEFITNPSGNDYRLAAESALSQGDAEQAASMVSAALALDPQNKACLALLDCIVATVKDPLGLFDTAKHTFFGRVAVRARILAAQGRVLEALGILARVVTFRPEVAYLTWVPEWLGRAVLPTQETPSRVIRWRPLLLALGPAEREQDPRRQNAEAAADILTFLVHRYPEDHDLLVHCVQWLERLDQHERMLKVLLRVDATRPSSATQLLLGQSMRRRGLVQDSITHFEAAVAMNPAQPALWLDLGDAQLEAGNPEPALVTYGRVLELDPGNTKALAGRSYILALRSNDPTQLEELRATSANEPRAKELLLDAEFLEQYLDYPETPGTQILFDFCHRSRGSGQLAPKLRLRATNPEPPSFYQAFRFTTQALDLLDAELEITSSIPPGARLDPEALRLWDYSQSCPHPILPRPDDSTVHAVSALTSAQPSGIEGHLERVAALSVSPEQLASAAFHAPPPPSRALSPPEWLFRFQVLCLLGIVRSEQDWVGSSRRRWLYDLATGPVDWISAAAMVALGVVLKENTDAATEVQRWFRRWLSASPVNSPHCYERYLVASWMRASSLSADDEQRLWLRRMALRPRLRLS